MGTDDDMHFDGPDYDLARVTLPEHISTERRRVLQLVIAFLFGFASCLLLLELRPL